MKKHATLAALVVVGLSGSALADHISGHNNNDPVWPVPIPGQDQFDGGVLFVSAIGPIGGYTVTEAVFDITYVSDGVTAASELAIDVGVGTTGGFLEFHLTGADLGFGAGAGTFTGTFSTHALDGEYLEGFLLPPYSQVNLTIGSVNGAIDGVGYFEESFINLSVVPAPGVLAGGVAMAPMVLIRRRRRAWSP